MLERYPYDKYKLYGIHKKYLGVDVVINGTFSTDTDWNLPVPECTISGGTCTWDGTQIAVSNLRTTLTPLSAIGALVRIEYTVLGRTAGTIAVSAGSGGLPNGTTRSTNETFIEDIIIAGNTHIYFQADADFNGSIDNVKAQCVYKNHIIL